MSYEFIIKHKSNHKLLNERIVNIQEIKGDRIRIYYIKIGHEIV